MKKKLVKRSPKVFQQKGDNFVITKLQKKYFENIVILCNPKLSKKMWSILASSFRLDFLFWIISSLFPKKNWNMCVVLKREFLVRAINLLCEVAKDKNAKYGLKLEMTWHYFFQDFCLQKKLIPSMTHCCISFLFWKLAHSF